MHITAKATFINIFSEKQGRGQTQIDQHDLICGEKVHVELTTSGSSDHQKISRGCAYLPGIVP